MIPFVALMLLACQAQQPAPTRLLHPSEVYSLCYADCLQLQPELQELQLYLWIPNQPDQEELRRVIQGHCAQLSRNSTIKPEWPRMLRTVAGSADQIIALNIEDYGWTRQALDGFAQTDFTFNAIIVQRVEETYTEQVELEWPGGKDAKGIDYPKGTKYLENVKKTRTREEKKVQALAPWLVQSPGSAAAVQGLPALTHSKAPVVNALVWLDSTGTSGDGRNPDYYQMLGVKNEKDIFELAGISVAASQKFSGALMSAVSKSIITKEPRGIQRFDKIGGAYWRTLDVNHREAKDKKQPLRVFSSNKDGEPILEFDASEVYWHNPNRMFGTALLNNKGVIQDRAPDKVVREEVRSLVHCVECHKNGLQPIRDWVRNFPPELEILAGDREGKKRIDYKTVEQLNKEYARGLEEFIDGDIALYASALKKAVGMTPAQWSAKFPQAWKKAAEGPMDLEACCREWGVSPEQALRAIRHQLDLKKAEPVLAFFANVVEKEKTVASLLKTGKIKQAEADEMLRNIDRTIPRSAFAETYALMHLYLAEAGGK